MPEFRKVGLNIESKFLISGSDQSLVLSGKVLDLCLRDLGRISWKWSNVNWSGKSWLTLSRSDGNWLCGISNWASGISNWGSGISNWGSGVNGRRSNNGRSDDSGLGSWSNWEVGGSNSESVDGVSDVVDVLGQTISVNVRVSSSDISKSVLALSLGRWTTRISVGVLASFILGVELGGGQTNWGDPRGVHKPSVGKGQTAEENDSGLHFGLEVSRG